VIAKKFPNAMEMLMSTIPGMMTNMQDRMIVFMGQIGDRLKPYLKNVFKAFIEILNPDNFTPLANAIGEGLGLIMKALGMLLTPLAKFLLWVVDLAKTHPDIVKWGVALLGVAGALLTLAGAIVTFKGLMLVLEFTGAAATFTALKASLLSMAWPLVAVGVGIAILAYAWHKNIGGMQDTMRRWWNTFSTVVSAVIGLTTSVKNGIGTMSTETATKLQQAGLFDIVVKISMGLYRLYQVLCGIGEGAMIVVGFLAQVGAALYQLGTPIWWAVGCFIDLLVAIGLVTSKGHPSVWKAIGTAIGVIAAYLVVCRVAMVAYRGAMLIVMAIQGIWQAATWLMTLKLGGLNIVLLASKIAAWEFNAALWANPVMLIVGGILALVVALGLAGGGFEDLKKKYLGLKDETVKPPKFPDPPKTAENAALLEELAKKRADLQKRIDSHNRLDPVAKGLKWFGTMGHDRRKEDLEAISALEKKLHPETVKPTGTTDPGKEPVERLKKQASLSLDRLEYLRTPMTPTLPSAPDKDKGDIVLKVDGRELARTVRYYDREAVAAGSSMG
jgi:hypothetical protein